MSKVLLALSAALLLPAAAAPAHADDVRVLSYARLGQAAVFDTGIRDANRPWDSAFEPRWIRLPSTSRSSTS